MMRRSGEILTQHKEVKKEVYRYLWYTHIYVCTRTSC